MISKKLNDPLTAPKSYWSILIGFSRINKIPGFSPIFHNGKDISDFKEKTNLFNLFLPLKVHLCLTLVYYLTSVFILIHV